MTNFVQFRPRITDLNIWPPFFIDAEIPGCGHPVQVAIRNGGARIATHFKGQKILQYQ
jgi:hypothetical protein